VNIEPHLDAPSKRLYKTELEETYFNSEILTFGVYRWVGGRGSWRSTSAIMEIEKQTYKTYCGLRESFDRAKIKCSHI
jgi:hypothetical protein